MATIKVYGMDGLIEWHGTVKYGSHSMSIAFTNGGATAFGVNPATFTTSDSLTQYVIENCDKFKEGRIHIVRKIELPGEDDSEKEEQSNNVAKKQEEAEKPAEAPVITPKETEVEDGMQLSSRLTATTMQKTILQKPSVSTARKCVVENPSRT